MASSRIEELLRNASEKDRASVEQIKGTLEQRKYEVRDGNSDLQKPEVTNTKHEGPNTRTAEPLHKETTPEQSRLGADKIKQAMPDQSKSQAVDAGKSLEKSGASMAKQPERER